MRRPQWMRRRAGPRVLLLTSGLGTGHSRAAAAVGNALQGLAPGTRLRTVDFWSLLDASVTSTLHQAYLRLVMERPDLYQRLYQLDQHSWRNILEAGQPLPELLNELAGLIGPLADVPMDDGRRHWLDRLLFREIVAFLSRSEEGESALRELRQQAVIHQSWTLLARRLGREIQRFSPDAIIATQVNMAALAAHLKAQRRFRAPLIGVVTDYGVHDFWLQKRIDVLCIAAGSMAKQLAGTPGSARVEITGIPLMPEFSQPPSADAARRQLGLAQGLPVVLMLGGGLGLGIGSVLGALAGPMQKRQSPATLIVLAGRNLELAAELARDIALQSLISSGRLLVHGWTEQVATYMRAADIVIGKPGGLTTAEVLACGRPLFSTCTLRGQESFNVAYLEGNGIGQLLGEECLAERILDLLDDRQSLRQMQARAWSLGRRNGAQYVATRALASIRSRHVPGLAASPEAD